MVSGGHLPGAAESSLFGSCPQVLMRLGRQRWKLKGRIESDDSQTWEEEEKAFIPTLHDNFEIKVGGARDEARGPRGSAQTPPTTPTHTGD